MGCNKLRKTATEHLANGMDGDILGWDAVFGYVASTASGEHWLEGMRRIDMNAVAMTPGMRH